MSLDNGGTTVCVSCGNNVGRKVLRRFSSFYNATYIIFYEHACTFTLSSLYCAKKKIHQVNYCVGFA